MRSILICGLALFTLVIGFGCDAATADTPASVATSSRPVPVALSAADANRGDMRIFIDGASRPILHFRVRWQGRTFGRRDETKGDATTFKEVKEYYVAPPVVADVFLQPGADRLSIVRLADGKTMALYLQNLRIVGDHAEADTYGVSNNFGYYRHLASSEVHRSDGTEGPRPTRFVIGTPIQLGTIGTFNSIGRDSPMGPGYWIATEHKCTVELVAITTVAQMLEGDPSLTASPPPDVLNEIERDLGPTTRPAAH